MYEQGLETFLAVSRTLNISRAASELNLAQSTVSKRLQVLEQHIGMTLFERGHGVKLTPAGETFVDLAERWDALRRQIENFHLEEPKLALSIGAIYTVVNSFIPPLYNILRQHQPKIKLRIISSHSADLYDDIERRRVDVAFSVLKRASPIVMVEKCYSEPMVVMGRFEKYYLNSKIVHPHDLKPDNELYVNWDYRYQCWHDKWWDQSCWGRNQITTTLLYSALMHNPDSWVIAPLSLAMNAPETAKLNILYLSEEPPERTVYKLTHKEPTISTLQSLKIFDEALNTVIQHKSKWLRRE